jgi:CTP synthase (UTP-ammonia lyase)
MTIGLLGDFDPEVFTHRELRKAVSLLPDDVEARWIDSDAASPDSLDGVDGLWVFSGSPYRDDDAVNAAIAWALRSRTPFLGTCSGFQYACIVLALDLAGIDARHAERDPQATDPLVVELGCSLIGEEREVRCVPGTRLAAQLGTAPFAGFHWCRFGLADRFVDQLDTAGVVISARAPDAGVEAIELPSHPFFMATLFQPQVGSRADRPLNPLILALVEAARQASDSAERQH